MNIKKIIHWGGVGMGELSKILNGGVITLFIYLDIQVYYLDIQAISTLFMPSISS